jgi:NAD(P)-dependent dehydrogenase (short-subunit alcohol dehydrogenase family)
MARSMACELGEQKIRVNSLSPGHIYTRFVLRLITLQYQIVMTVIV